MASRRSFSLFWRVFLPIFILTWTIIGLMVWYSVRSEKSVRMERLDTQMRTITTSVLSAYEQGHNLQEHLDFINMHYDNTSFYNLRISVFDSTDSIVAHSGDVIMYFDDDDNTMHVPELNNARQHQTSTGRHQVPTRPEESLYRAATSNDGKITVVAAVPVNANVERIMDYNAAIWGIVIALGILATVLAGMIARRSSRIVNTLHRFAVATNQNSDVDIESFKLPRNEIGDVSREIMRLYHEKDKAIKRMEHEHEVALRANEEKARVKRQTANNLNHEIKTPVGIIKGYIDTICADPDMPPALMRSFLVKAQEHADRLTQLLKDVSSITRLEDGAQQVETIDFDFHDLAYNIASDLDVSHINGNLKFEWNVPFDTMVKANYTLVMNALMNLIKNAARYSGGTTMTLQLLEQDERFCTFEFKDDGSGVGEEHLPHLFDRFYRVDTGRARKSGGTGLGLPIVKSTFQALGGEIIVKNATPHGLEYVFTLPKPET